MISDINPRFIFREKADILVVGGGPAAEPLEIGKFQQIHLKDIYY